MSQCLAEDQDISKKFPTAVYNSPKFPEEPCGRGGMTSRIRRARKTSEAKVVSGLRKQLETTTFRLLVTAQSSEQFQELRDELFPKFVQLSSAIATLVPLPQGDSAQVVDAIFARLAQEFEADEWLFPRLADAKDEAGFCLATLHRAHFLAQDVLEGLNNGSLPEESKGSYAQAISAEWWSMLHLRCIIFALRHKIAPTNAVFLSLMEGFRTSVMAYTHARQAMEPQYRHSYDSVDFSSLTPHDGDYAPDTAYGA